MEEKACIIVTGASGSMGSAAVRSLATAGERVIMACRNPRKGESVRQSILAEVPGADIELRILDLSSLSSVREFAASMQGIPVKSLFNNAGIINRDFSITADGLEATTATNYVGPYLLTRLLIPQMVSGAHIVNMVSVTTKVSYIGEDFLVPDEKSFSQLGTYGKTKYALSLFTIALARRYPELYINMSDPGVVNSNMISMHRWFDPIADVFFRPFCKTPEQGVAPALRALEATDHLKYFVGKRTRDVSDRLLDDQTVDILWNSTADFLGLGR
ncbi:MAG: SDR family NAD(P)-dependent oxidoreductase [Bacteroidales bacterium]|nr:SDR family NAD(P)-dependent oxidoreductase [Bacteroidales bacterium]